MSERRPDPLERELRALLDKERAARPSRAALDRVWSRVEVSVAVGACGGSPRSATGGGAGWVASHAGTLIAAAFCAGAATGAGMMMLRKPVERVVDVERVAPGPSVAATATSPEQATPPPSAVAVVPAPATPPVPVHAMASAVTAHPAEGPHASSAAPSEASSLQAERALLDRAQAALAQGNGARAVALTDEHATRFARPQLREEREAIAIQGLVLEGRYEDARERAKKFRAASPDSLFLPAVTESLGSIP